MTPADREVLILSLTRNVTFIARGISRRLPLFVPIDDLVSEGWIGAIYAVDHWQPEKGGLGTFADPRIRGAVMDYLRRIDPVSRDQRRAYNIATKAALAAHVTPPAPPVRIVAIDSPKHPKVPGEMDPRATLPGVNDPCFRKTAARLDVQKLLKISGLTAREHEVIRGVFLEEKPAVEISRGLGCHQTRGCQLKHSALTKLRAAA